MPRPRVVGIPGSLRETSYTRLALVHALDAAAEAGAEATLIDLREYDLPQLDPDREPHGDASRLADAVRGADSVVLGTPMYHGSYSSPLKAALDYCGFEEFEDTTVGLLAVSGGAFPVTALDHLRTVCRALNAWVVPHQAVIPRASSHFTDGELTDEGLADRIETLGRRAVEFSNIEPDPPCFESEHNEYPG